VNSAASVAAAAAAQVFMNPASSVPSNYAPSPFPHQSNSPTYWNHPQNAAGMYAPIPSKSKSSQQNQQQQHQNQDQQQQMYHALLQQQQLYQQYHNHQQQQQHNSSNHDSD
jgi:hypothetical protein